MRGTHAHSWVLSFDSEAEAFRAWAETMPHQSLFLVDTFDTEVGVRNAIAIGRDLRRNGHDLQGIRLDSGDLAYLSNVARRRSTQAGFPEARIMASNDLDEETIESLRIQTRRLMSGGSDEAGHVGRAAGARRRLQARRDARGRRLMAARAQSSEQPDKTTVPGILSVRRYYDERGTAAGDAIVDELTDEARPLVIVHPTAPHRRKRLEGLPEQRSCCSR